MNKKQTIKGFFGSQAFAIFIHIALDYKWLYIGIILLRILQALFAIGLAEVTRRLFNDISDLSIIFCVSIVGATALLKCFNMVAEYFRQWIESLLNESIVTSMRWTLLRKATYLKYSFYEETHIARVHKVFFTDLEAVKDLLVTDIPDLICLPINFIGVGIYLFMIHPLLVLIVLLVGPSQLLSNKFRLKDYKKITKELNDFDYKYFLMMEETVQGIREIKENALEKDTMEHFRELCKKGIQLDVKNVKVRTSRSLMKNMPQEMAYLAGLTVIFYLMLQNKIEIGACVVFTTLLSYVADSFGKIVNSLSNLYGAIANSEDLCEMMELEEEEFAEGEEVAQGPISVEFQNVKFSYENDKQVLDGVSFKVPAGSTVAVVGPSGGGKTTLTKLLQRFYNLSEGNILINDLPIEEYSLGALRQSIAVVPQDPFLYAMSVQGNICIGKQDATMEEIRKAAEMADIAAFIETLPELYDTEIGQRGVKLSQGQRQRIVIARAMIKEASLIILDEATSALDVETEDNFQSNFNKMSRNCTKIIIAHRLATIREADYIAFIENGKATEYGTLEELLEKKCRFYEYWNKQVNINVS